MAPSRLLAVRADGGPGVGAGHLARSLALVQAWRDDGGDAVLLTDDHDRGWLGRYQAEGARVEPVGALPSLDPAWLVVDGYRFGSSELLAARGRGAHVLVVDDHGLGHAGPADSLLDQNLGATASAYRDRVEADGLLLGPRFALLRREFSVARPTAVGRRTPDRARRVLFSLGGDPPEAVAEMFEAIAGDLSSDHEVRWLRGTTDVTFEMLRADLAVAASGTTCLELCCLGLPMALVSTVDNQRPAAEALGRAGIALDLGSHLDLDAARAADVIRGLSTDAGRRQEMTQAGLARVDAGGARRVVAHLRGRRLALRPVVEEDARLLWQWVNDPATRAFSFNSAPIPWEEHQQWLRRKLDDPGCTMFVAEATELGSVGQVRFDQRGDRAVIGVAVAPEHRGEGWGPAVIDAGVRAFQRHRPVVAVDAVVKAENAASARSFDIAGFEPADPAGNDQEPCLRFVRSLVDEP